MLLSLMSDNDKSLLGTDVATNNIILVKWQHRFVITVTEKPQSSTLFGMQNVGQKGLILIKYRKPFKY